MATGRKYAGLLPDLDEDRDLFETPELTHDTSTLPSDSVTFDEEEDDETDEDEVSGISRRHVNADDARLQFHTSVVDARRADFSDRLDNKRKSYRVSSRRKGEGAASDEEDATPKDGLKRKIAALLREAEELKVEAKRQDEGAESNGQRPDPETLQQLSGAISILEEIDSSAGRLGAEARLAKQLSEVARQTNGDAATPESRQAPTYTLSYQPSFDDTHALSLAASFDTRLKGLENALGLTSIPLPTQVDSAPKLLLPTLDILEKQIELLSSTTPSSLDTMSKRIRQLTDEADRLHEKRKAAKQSYSDMRTAANEAATAGGPSKADDTSTSLSLIEDAEMETKITALYNTLPTIESLAPTLPAVLERLKSLRLLHADAADAVGRIERAEKLGMEMHEEIKMWRGGLEKLEKAGTDSEVALKKNMEVVEKWVRELEGRAKKLHVED